MVDHSRSPRAVLEDAEKRLLSKSGYQRQSDMASQDFFTFVVFELKPAPTELGSALALTHAARLGRDA